MTNEPSDGRARQREEFREGQRRLQARIDERRRLMQEERERQERRRRLFRRLIPLRRA